MNWKLIRWKIRYYWQYFPFTLNSLFCTIAGWWAINTLKTKGPKGEAPSQLLPFIIIMGKVAVIFIAVLVGVSVLSTFLGYIYYMYLRGTKGYWLKVEFNVENKKGRNLLYLNAQVQGVIRPLLGFVKGRLYYDDNVFTDRFSLLSNKRKENSLLRLAITGKSQVYLPDIKEYELKGGFIYFQDMLHLVSLAVPQEVSGRFYQPPVTLTEETAEVYPKKTENMDVRIEQLRRVEGEYLNYKDFEAGDDVRRIVWKVYARNRELVVRTPELFEPYASHLYFYASFFAGVKGQWLGSGYLKEMLNYYKNNVWTVYESLSKKDWSMRYIPDQSFTMPEHLTEAEKCSKIISNSNWHTDTDLLQYFNPRHGSALCITSFTNIDDLANLLERCDGATMVYYVKLSRVLKQNVGLNLIKRIFFLPPQDRRNKLRNKWVFSPMRLQVLKREKEIEALLEKSNVLWGVL